jgi:hypothetical protein
LQGRAQAQNSFPFAPSLLTTVQHKNKNKKTWIGSGFFREHPVEAWVTVGWVVVGLIIFVFFILYLVEKVQTVPATPLKIPSKAENVTIPLAQAIGKFLIYVGVSTLLVIMFVQNTKK